MNVILLSVISTGREIKFVNAQYAPPLTLVLTHAHPELTPNLDAILPYISGWSLRVRVKCPFESDLRQFIHQVSLVPSCYESLDWFLLFTEHSYWFICTFDFKFSLSRPLHMGTICIPAP